MPNGTRLIRRDIRAVPTAGGARKRKKPGRIGRPLVVKYSVPIPRNVNHALELDADPTAGGARKRKKPGRIGRPLVVKYSVPIPRNVNHALELDADAGNTFWAGAIQKDEVESLLALDSFLFHAPDYKPSSEYQWTKLTMI